MITFIRNDDCEGCAAMEEAMSEMSLACRTLVLGRDEQADKQLPAGRRAPVLLDEGEIFEGREEILARLSALKVVKKEWEKFQTDACYCDDEGEVI